MNLSLRVSVCGSRRQYGGQGSCQCPVRKGLQSQVGSRADKVLSPAGQSLWQLMPREISVEWSSALVCGARCREPVCFKSGKCDSALYGKPTEVRWWAGARPSNRVFPWESGLENAYRLWLALAKTPSPWSETVDVCCLSSR